MLAETWRTNIEQMTRIGWSFSPQRVSLTVGKRELLLDIARHHIGNVSHPMDISRVLAISMPLASIVLDVRQDREGQAYPGL